MSVNFDWIKDLPLKLGLGAVVWEVFVKPLIKGRIDLNYAKKLEAEKAKFMRDLEQIKSSTLTDLEDIRHKNLMAIEEYKRALDSSIKRQEMLFDAQLKSEIKEDEIIFEKKLPIYQELSEVLYRCRNLARACSEGTRTIKTVSEFSQFLFHLTENLYKYRLFIPDDTFRELHRFKIQLQEFSIRLDEVTRSMNVDDAPVDPEVRNMAEEQILDRYKAIDSTYAELSSLVNGFL